MGIFTPVAKLFGRTPMQKLEKTIANGINRVSKRHFNDAMSKGVSEGAAKKIGTAFDGVTEKISTRMADKMVNNMFPSWFRRHKILTLFGAGAAGTVGYNMLGRNTAGSDPSGYQPSPEQLGRMAAEEEFSQELQVAALQQQQMGGYGQPMMGPPMPQQMASSPVPYMAAAQSNIQIPRTAMVDAASASYQGRMAPGMAMEQSI